MKYLVLRGLLSAITITACSFSVQAQSKLSGNSNEVEKLVDSLVQPLIDKHKIAGMVVGIRRGDSTILLKPYGYADVEFNVPLPVKAFFEIGSMTKQFTAVAVLQLAEKGLLQLDDPMNKYLEVNLKDVTIRQLLHHTSGISGLPMGHMIYHTFPRDTLLRMIEKSKPDFAPGSGMMYSNIGYILLGMIIEKISGVTYEEYLLKNVLAPAGMMGTYMSDQQKVRKDRAHGYNYLDEGGELTRAEQPQFYWTFSAGALSSTINDLLQWNRVLHESNKLLKPESYAELIKGGILNDGTQTRYAEGFQVLQYKNYEVIGHGGSGSGVLCDARYFPSERLTIITLQNTFRRASESEITYAIANRMLPEKNSKVQKYKGDLLVFKGTYKGLTEVSVDVVNSELVVKRSWQTSGDKLTYIGNNKWSLGNDLYSFKIENKKVKELHWDAISAFIVLNKVN